MDNPYSQTKKGNSILREFDENVQNEELVWHRDNRDRTIIPIESNGWMFQRDNHPPFEIEKGKHITVEAEEFHRIIKGSGNLVILIVEGQ